jgi:hypothetical protein
MPKLDQTSHYQEFGAHFTEDPILFSNRIFDSLFLKNVANRDALGFRVF